MITLDGIRKEDLPFIELRSPSKECDERGLINEPQIIDKRTGKPYVYADS